MWDCALRQADGDPLGFSLELSMGEEKRAVKLFYSISLRPGSHSRLSYCPETEADAEGQR